MRVPTRSLSRMPSLRIGHIGLTRIEGTTRYKIGKVYYFVCCNDSVKFIANINFMDNNMFLFSVN